MSDDNFRIPDFPEQQRDEKRHRDRIKRRLSDGIKDIINRRDIITKPGERQITIPIGGDDDPIIRIRPRKGAPKVAPSGIAQGPAKPGQKLGQIPKKGPGIGGGSEGHGPTYTITMTPEELAEWVFAEMNLPVIQPRESLHETEEVPHLSGRAKKGEMSRLDKKDSFLRHMRREILTGDGAWHDDDLRYRNFRIEERPSFEATVVFVRDASGSMGEEETQLVYLAAWWTVLWLRRNYPTVRPYFVVHGTEGREVPEEEFFKVADMGGTLVSSGLAVAQEILSRHASSNQYVLFFSDGYNWIMDNPRLLEILKKLLESCDLVGYGEVMIQRGFDSIGSDRLLDLLREFSQTVSDPDRILRFHALKPGQIREFLLAMFAGALRDS